MKTTTNKELHYWLNKLGLMEQKKSLVFSFSEGQTDSSKDMKEYQAIDLIKHLKGKAKEAGIEAPKPKKDALQATRRYIISRWYLAEGASNDAEKKAALEKCLSWVEKNFKAELNSFEMPKLMVIKAAAEKVLKDRAKHVRKKYNNANA
ncbi:MAG: hypothetical protein ACOVQ4_04070 [Flectobacillus sp.]|uniref:hypothetical protein n=1 Tax=Flectobacillus sp. TaxID=50419 RepID=UPI003B9C9618